jgi:hypothetical protein
MSAPEEREMKNEEIQEINNEMNKNEYLITVYSQYMKYSQQSSFSAGKGSETVGFEDFTVMTVKGTIFWDIMNVVW